MQQIINATKHKLDDNTDLCWVIWPAVFVYEGTNTHIHTHKHTPAAPIYNSCRETTQD